MNEGWISRRKGRFVYRFMTVRASDGKRVENLKVIGLISDLKTEKAALIEATKKGYTSLASTPAIGKLSFDDLAKHYITHELDKSEGKIGRKASETITRDKHNINKHCVPRWGTTPALNIKPLALEAWYESLSEELAWQTIAKIRSAMSQVFNHGYRHGLLPGNKHENPVALSRCPESSAYEAVVVTPEQMIVMLNELDTPKTQMEWMIALLHAATALRPEEAFGLQWQDVDWKAGRINIQRAWSKGEPTAGKNRGSMTQVVMSPVLAEALRRWNRLTVHREPSDWLFPSLKEKGRIPRSAVDLQQVLSASGCDQSGGDSQGLRRAVWLAQHAAFAGHVLVGQRCSPVGDPVHSAPQEVEHDGGHLHARGQCQTDRGTAEIPVRNRYEGHTGYGNGYAGPKAKGSAMS